MRNATSLIPERLSCTILAITCSENVYARSCIYSQSHVLLESDSFTKPAICVMRRHMQVQLSPIFEAQEKKCLLASTTENESLESFFSNANMIQYGQFSAIFRRPEVAGDVISGRNGKTVERYVAVNVEVAISSTFRNIKKSFRAGRGGGGHRR